MDELLSAPRFAIGQQVRVVLPNVEFSGEIVGSEPGENRRYHRDCRWYFVQAPDAESAIAVPEPHLRPLSGAGRESDLLRPERGVD